MTAQGVYKITEDFEKALCDYTGAPYAVALDSCSHAIFLALKYELLTEKILPKIDHITIPRKTFPSVPCEIIHCGKKVNFWEKTESFDGIYQLWPSKVWDCALRFTHNMYEAEKHMCISFSGPRKRLKLVKGGAILTDDAAAVEWFKMARMSGRHECPFKEDNITFAGWHFYLLPELAARGLALIREFYDDDGNPIPQEDVKLEYPNLSKMEAFK